MADKVSVILTVYNMESCLRETMDTVLSQTYRDLEVVCIDDGSKDGSLQILEEYAAGDERVAVYTQDNAGPALSRNRGIDLATGEYLMLLDSDDIYDCEMIEKLHGRAVESDADIVVCRSVEYDHATGAVSKAPWTAKVDQIPAKDPFSCADMYDYILTAFIGWPWDKLYRRSFVEDNALRFPPMSNSEDLYFVFLSLVLARRISFYDEVLIKHRMNRSGSVSNSRTANPTEFYHGICLLKEKLQEDPVRYERMSWGFLNWAFDYTLWNIETLPAGPVRRGLIERLVNGGFPEIELAHHGVGYFTLTADCHERYASLAAELGGAVPCDPRRNDKHPRLSYVVAFFAEAQKRGYKSAFGDMVYWAIRKIKGEEEDGKRHAKDRGALLSYVGAGAVESGCNESEEQR
ncbi:glycosyltransferase family 2 protein [Raoultibacter massiliensis]|uniref:Glycosyltransferase family 2 protein n=1 Tax=Raoultibacter massiliensis TaxID=1852371 RepID=A0ABV1JCE3_9ACTN|nr:glycosyltransferase family 2 protein [Raoultibacter massiliensis]